MPRQTEPSANNATGGLLQAMLPRSSVRSEHTQAISGHPGLQPDILITAPGRAPVVVEAEYMPAHTVESEAKERLGLEVASNGRVIESVIALRYPEDIREAHDLHATLSSARLSYCVFTEGDEDVRRFPESGWLDGDLEDLADMVRLVSVPQRAVDRASTALQEGIDGAARLLDELNETRAGVTTAIARLLGMSNVPQTRRMACAIIANALVFHERIAGMHEGVKTLAVVCGDGVDNPQGEVLAAWGDILKINYWAIFAIAKDILEQLPSGDAADILRRLRHTAQAVDATGVDNAHDLTGRIFQRLIADRKYLATFYTLPASAALLARLAVAKLEGVDWSDAEAVGRLRIGDFACGTGALLSAVYEQIAARHERAGGDAAALHKVMMEEALYGCDVMPSAVHITGSTLSGVEPSVLFNSSHLYTMPYGRDITGPAPRGPFDKAAPSPTATYPALWSHDARRETRMVCLPDSQLLVRPGMEYKAADVWETASQAHLNLGFRFNTQPLAIAFTNQHSIGGRAWPNVNFSVREYNMALTLWGNSTLGILCYWWNAGRQDAGRGDMTIRSAEYIPVLDLRALTDEQLRTAEDIFNEFRDLELKPAYVADADPNRALDEDTYAAVRRLTAKWCAEPSVHGGKARPKGARAII